jgi:hypothetical protein
MNKDKTTKIENFDPHYTNRHFSEARTVWGEEQPGLLYEYSDRLWEWDYAKATLASGISKDKFPVLCANRIEVFLSEYFGKPVQIFHIMAGFNRGNGYPYQIFGYKEK